MPPAPPRTPPILRAVAVRLLQSLARLAEARSALRRATAAAGGLTMVLAAACAPGDSTAPPIGRLEIVSGNAQFGLAGDPLDQPLVLRATRDGTPTRLPVTFIAEAGELDAAIRTTKHDGTTSVRWTLPATIEAGTVLRLTASASDVAPIEFTARAAHPDEADLVLATPGLPVQLLVYPASGFARDAFVQRAFTDSVRLLSSDRYGEVIAFARGRAPLLRPTAWTPGRDTVRLAFDAALVRLPITIWIVQPPFATTASLVQKHLAGVVESWEEQAGIGLDDVRIVDATAIPGAERFQDALGGSCDPTLGEVVGHEPGRINAYYIGQPPLGSAHYCGGGVMEIFPLAHERGPHILAHEIGHGLLGLHHESATGNLMTPTASGRALTAGQRFRAHYSATSLLNSMFDIHPAALRRACASDPTSERPICPPTAFDLP